MNADQLVDQPWTFPSATAPSPGEPFNIVAAAFEQGFPKSLTAAVKPTEAPVETQPESKSGNS